MLIFRSLRSLIKKAIDETELHARHKNSKAHVSSSTFRHRFASGSDVFSFNLTSILVMAIKAVSAKRKENANYDDNLVILFYTPVMTHS